MTEHYDNPDGSVWTIAVDFLGRLSIVLPPDEIWDGFYSETTIEDNGWPHDTSDVGPGVYRVTAKYTEHKDPDNWTGPGEEWWEFNPVKWEPLWTPDEVVP